MLLFETIFITVWNSVLLKDYRIFFFFFNVFLTAWGLRCCAQAFPSYSDQGLLFVAVRRLLIAVASLVAEHRL